ncbi:hypothetical protein ABPG74_013946 [Tetrahymena malaccensis]
MNTFLNYNSDEEFSQNEISQPHKKFKSDNIDFYFKGEYQTIESLTNLPESEKYISKKYIHSNNKLFNKEQYLMDDLYNQVQIQTGQNDQKKYDYVFESKQQDIVNEMNKSSTNQDKKKSFQLVTKKKLTNTIQVNQKSQNINYGQFKFSATNIYSFGEQLFKCYDFYTIKSYDKFDNQIQYLGALQMKLSSNLQNFDFIQKDQIHEGKIQPGKILKVSWQNQIEGDDIDFYKLRKEMNTFISLDEKIIGYIDHTYSFIWNYLLNKEIINIYPYFFSDEGDQIHIFLEVYINHDSLSDSIEQSNDQQQGFNKCMKTIDKIALQILFNILRLKRTQPSLIKKDQEEDFDQFPYEFSQQFPKVLITCKKTYDYYESQLKQFPNHFVDFYSVIKQQIKMPLISEKYNFNNQYQTKPIIVNKTYPSRLQSIYYLKKEHQNKFQKTAQDFIITAEENKQEQSINTDYSNKQLHRFYQSANQPRDVVSNLHPYQLQGLQWLLYRERRVDKLYMQSMQHMSLDQKSKLDIYYEEFELVGGSKIYNNTKNNKFQSEFPELEDMMGGILADEMGLGKTLMIISLIHETKRERTAQYGTLIVTPSNLVSQWENQFKKHSKADSISILNLYQKSNRSKNFEDYDVVICSYNILCGIFDNQELSGKMFNKFWDRVIIDEAQKIKNKKSKVSEASFEIQSNCRWCLTGTPLENSLEDIYSLFRFLNVPKYSEWSWWSQNIKNSKKNNKKSNSFKIINQMIENFTLRRTKQSVDANGASIVSLPEKKIKNIYIELFENEKNIYKKIFDKTQEIYKFFQQKQNKQRKNYIHIFEVLSKLRRFCVHPSLTFKKEEETIKTKDQSVDDIVSKINTFLDEIQSKIKIQNPNLKNQNQNDNKEKAEETQNKMSQYQKEVIQQIKDGQYQVCSICLEDIKYHSISSCLHVFCSTCLQKSVEVSHRCPNCRKYLNMSDILQFVDENTEIYEELGNYFNEDIISGSKIQKIIEIIEEIHKKGEKVVLFSQWIDTLNLLEKHLQKKNISSMRFEGKLSRAQKQKSLYHFENNSDLQESSSEIEYIGQQEEDMEIEESTENNEENIPKTPTVLLASLMSGYVGLNLIGANHLILCDSWWNPAIEDQAINRIHRIGQQKQTHIYKMICKDTIEERIQEINDQKRDLFQSIFDSSEQNNDKKAKQFLSEILN